MRKIGISLLLLLVILTGCSVQTTEDNTFVVGMECAYAPYNWTQSEASDSAVAIDGGQYCDGYDVQIAKRIAQQLGKELVIKKIAWEGLILSLQVDQIDAIIAGMSPTDERKQEISFSNVYYTDEEVGFGVVVSATGAYASGSTIEDFANARIASQIGTFHSELLDQLTGVVKATNMKDFPTMITATQAGEIDGFIADSGTGDMVNTNSLGLVYLPLGGDEGFVLSDAMTGVAIGVKKENTDLLADINQALTTITNEEQAELMDIAVNSGDFSGLESLNFFQEVGVIVRNNYQQLLSGTFNTLLVSLLATTFGFLIALLVTIVRQNRIGGWISQVYIAIFRGTPMMVQAMVIFYGTSMLFTGFNWSNIPYGNMIAGVIVVSINTGAYMAETIRSGIQALDKGQFEAAQALGFSKRQTMMTIILPQAIRNVIPAIGNELIVNVKDTSVLNIISVTELFFVSNGIASTTLRIFQTFTITSVIYLVLTMALTLILRFVELRLDKTKTRPSSYPASVSDASHF